MQFIKFISNTLKISVTNYFIVFTSKSPKKYILFNSFIKKNLKLIVKNKIKKLCFRLFKQCLSDQVMQFIKCISNTLKIFVTNLCHTFHVKELKKYISCNSFIKKDLKLIVKKTMFSTLKTMFKWSGYAIYQIHFIVFTSKNPKKNISCNNLIKKVI